MVPLPMQGHLNQLLHLASRLILSYNIPVHYVATATHNRQAKHRVQGWQPQVVSNIHFHNLEIPPPLHPLPPPANTSDADDQTKFPSHLQPVFDAISLLQGPVSALLRSLSRTARKVAVVHDSLTASLIQEVGLISNAESYTFHSSSAFVVHLYLKHRAGEAISEEIPALEGCFTKEFCDFIEAQYKYRNLSSGFLYNTCRIIEHEYLDSLEKGTTEEQPLVKHWAVGPLNPLTTYHRNSTTKTSKDQRHPCLEWLDKQGQNSVIYVSFGTATTLSDDQIEELAIGLKQSQHKFIWVLRDADEGDVFSGGNDLEAGRRKPQGLLPDGYEEWVEEGGMGLVVRDWAPQLEILGHRATGGFMSHCGWNSCMESISMGVPLAAWPMHSDQPRNTILITEVLKIGIVARPWEHRHETVGSQVVESVVRKLMGSQEGEDIRKRAAELGDCVRRSVGEGGVSSSEMDSFVAHITTTG
ncbi:hypothetical protein Tsubulata_031990 [Turnera subulata]|uniref:Glycosyltransferase n=1 Tax=Turnera subulata TaxID=218843 RepID=A0A9Q0GCQ2_9ROSI|nr:hypothetical protein Tsubulata_031990 [Turnera subulata]